MTDALNPPMEDSGRGPPGSNLTTFDARLVGENNGKLEKIPHQAPARRPTEEVLMGIEDEFLTPPNQFSDEWLDKFQK
ncbi:DEAD/DEAH box RNA helicase (Ski2) [Penicillium bovifimosum]|uniref:DEAD/DEAH box RNA helicase (Ski2) n=1 Tax=Penicillium bovifimosum TaxID=126998 RepID=A0A9W9HE70_9EURO|nr:DEAD/DEAH box RNA helicase (Ski2) [Penicillium bovifimosum]KAJ5143873.1 DEAD/DEAH box RNA helicase (Ski2) [Penicillium bovifimosum]